MANRPNNKQIHDAIQVLKAGGVIVFPTETSYGIGCDATNKEAVRRVFAIKGRPDGKGTPLIVDSLAMAEKWGTFDSLSKRLANTYWPGALTIIVPARAGLSKDVLQDKTVALRLSSHPIPRALAKGLGKPLVATSANLSGQPAAFTVRDAKQMPVDVFVSGGTLRPRKASTLVRVLDGKPIVLRQGSVRL